MDQYSSFLQWAGKNIGLPALVLLAGFGVLFWLSGEREKDPQNQLSQQQVQFQKSVMDRVKDLEQDQRSLMDMRDELLKRINDLVIENAQLRARLDLMESAQMNLPWPMWLKDKSGVMLALNPAYERKYLLPRGLTRSDYIGKRDIDVWPEEIARAFGENDRETAERGRVQDFWELIIVDGRREYERFLKYPRYVNGILIGIGGMQIPPEPDKPGESPGDQTRVTPGEPANDEVFDVPKTQAG